MNREKQQQYCISINDIINLDANLVTLSQCVAFVQSKPEKYALDITKSEMDKAYTMTTYFLAQAHEQIGEYPESAQYCHITLRQQYPQLGTVNYAVDHVEWALNAATLAQYFANNDQFNPARHMICCARKVLNEASDHVKQNESERWKKAHADLDRIEVKYCLLVMDESAKLIQQGQMERCTAPSSSFRFG